MNVNHLSSKDLRTVLRLLERKELHEAKVAQIERQIADLCGEQASSSAPRTQIGRSSGRGKRGHVKDAVVGVLQQSGAAGITLKQICQKLGLSQSRLNSWLHATGKKIDAIKKIGRGQYAWVE